MGYLLRMSAEIHDWLADLGRSDPPAAVLAGAALAALMSEGASLEAPLVTAVADPRPGDLRAALDLSYQVRLEQLQVARRRAAGVATLVHDSQEQLAELESGPARRPRRPSAATTTWGPSCRSSFPARPPSSRPARPPWSPGAVHAGGAAHPARPHPGRTSQRMGVPQERASAIERAEPGDLLGTTRQAAFQRFGRPIDPRTGVLMAEELLPGAAELATALFADLAEQRWDHVTADFDQRVAAKLDAPGLAAVWAQVIGAAGEYQGMGDAVAHQAGDYTVVDVPLHFEAANLTGRVSYDHAGQVAGLFFM